MRLLGIQIANGYSPEARVFGALLSHTDQERLQTLVLYHRWSGDVDSAKRFQSASGANVQTLDFGWRSVASDRSFGEKARARLQFLAALPRALAVARGFQPDVIYSSQQFWDCQAAAYIARKLNRPQVIHLHYTIGPSLHQPILDRLRTCAHVVTVSEYIREEALRHGVAPENLTTIRNTIALPPPPDPGVGRSVRREFGIAPDAPLLGSVARLDPKKGQSDILQAFAVLLRTYPAARLLIVGEETPWHPGYGGRLQHLAEELGLGSRVLFAGRRTDVPRLLAAMTVFVHPSREEPFGLAIAEASAMALPVVAYAEGGAKEIIVNGITGWLSPPGDIEALAAALGCLLADPAGACAMGRTGRERIASEFQPATAGPALLSILAHVIEATSGKQRETV